VKKLLVPANNKEMNTGCLLNMFNNLICLQYLFTKNNLLAFVGKGIPVISGGHRQRDVSGVQGQY
jgi:hypothetical protein